jgi:hypothetical protein
MFRQLRVHTPAPLTPDRQRAADQAAETFVISFTPARRGGHEAGLALAPSPAARSETSLGAMATAPDLCRSASYDSAADDDLRRCTRCGESREYCHGHTPIVPNPTLNLPPQIPVQAPVSANRMAGFNLSHVQAMALADRLLGALKQNDQDPPAVPPANNYREEFARVVAEGLSINPAITAEGVGLRGGRCQHQNRGRGGQPQQLPDARRPTNPPQASGPTRRPAR